MRYSKIIVTMVIFLNIIFATAVLYIFKSVGSEPSVLIGGWFAFTTGELWALAMLKNKEVKKDDTFIKKDNYVDIDDDLLL